MWLRGLHTIFATSCIYIYIFLVTIIKIFVLYCIVLYERQIFTMQHITTVHAVFPTLFMKKGFYGLVVITQYVGNRIIMDVLAVTIKLIVISVLLRGLVDMYGL